MFISQCSSVKNRCIPTDAIASNNHCPKRIGHVMHNKMVLRAKLDLAFNNVKPKDWYLDAIASVGMHRFLTDEH